MPPSSEFEALFYEYQRLVFNLCLSYLQNTEDAEEATQDIFVKIYEKTAGFQGNSQLKTWIYRIAVNHCLDILRKRKRRLHLSGLVSIFFNTPQLEIPAFDHPGIQFENREALENLFSHINTLPDQQKTALLLRYTEDLSPPEIAVVMKTSVKAVESLLHRAKQNLEKKLTGGEGK